MRLKTRTKTSIKDFADFYRLFYSLSWAICFRFIHFIRPSNSKFLLTPSRHVGFHVKSLIPSPLLCRICNTLPPFLLPPPPFFNRTKSLPSEDFSLKVKMKKRCFKQTRNIEYLLSKT